MCHRSGAIYGICKPLLMGIIYSANDKEFYLILLIIIKGLQICFMELNGATDEHLITCPS